MKVIIHALHELNYHPGIIYNSNGYDKLDELKKMEGLVDVYLPDLKYADESLGWELSGVKDYPNIAFSAIKEMYRQMGSRLQMDDEGYARRVC